MQQHEEHRQPNSSLVQRRPLGRRLHSARTQTEDLACAVTASALRRFTLKKAVALATLIASGAAATAATVAGNFAGQFSVSESGAASYQLAIPVPPGVAGLEPKLSLAYSSQGGNGLAGVGWTIAGLSSISRCPRTQAQDGARGAVDFTLNDRYCLDGQRLVLVKGDYGVAGSEYRTEIDSFSRITALGRSGQGPQSFLVQTKAGLRYEYGASDSSRLMTNLPDATLNTTAVSWAVNKVTDASGNVMSIDYRVEKADGAHFPSKIIYGAGASSQAAVNEVAFEYESRDDVGLQFHAGSRSRLSLRLKSIKTAALSEPVQSTSLTYRAISGSTGRSLLAAVQRCDAGGLNCMAPITLGWLDRDLKASLYDQSQGEISAVVDWGYIAGRAWVDFNGDGRSDYCRVIDVPPAAVRGAATKAIRCSLSPITPSPEFLSGGPRTNEKNFFEAPMADAGYDPSRAWVDINGDGRTDYCRRVNTAGVGTEMVCNLSLANGFGPDIRSGLIDPGYDAGRAWVDLGGDGRADFCRVIDSNGSDARLMCTLSTATGLNGRVIFSQRLDAGYLVGRAWVDVNGDGRPDYCRVTTPTTKNNVNRQNIRCALFNGSGFDDQLFGENLDAGFDEGREWVDVNGDGQADYCRVIRSNSGQGQIQCALSTGLKLDAGGEITSALIDVGYTEGRAWVDVNGDGRADYCRVVGPTSHPQSFLQCSQFTGTGWTESAKFGPTNHGYGDGRAWVDVNGDGKADYCRRVGDNNNQTSYVQCTSSPFHGDLIGTIVSGSGAALKVEYQSLAAAPSGAAVYTKDAGSSAAVYPVIDIQAPSWVVSTARRSDGLGGMLATRYSYGGQKGELGTGRGALGFRWSRSVEEATGVETYAEFQQTWPFIGMPAKTETRMAGKGNAGLLKRVTHSNACLNTLTANECVPSACLNPLTASQCSSGQVHFPHVASTVEESWDLNGAAYPMVTSAYSYARDGNLLYGDVAIVSVSTSDGANKTVRNEYWPANTSGDKWQLGRLKRATATSTAPDAGPGSVQGNWLAPTLKVTRQPEPMKAGLAYSVTWESTGATQVAYDCTAGGTGYNGRGWLDANGTVNGVADAKWVGNPSRCVWAAYGPGGVKTLVENLSTLASPAPTLSIARTPAPLLAGQAYTLTWKTTDATSLRYACTAGGSGYRGQGTLPVNGSTSGVADPAWIGADSTCTYTATGPGGTVTRTETFKTTAVVPTLTIARTPATMVAGQVYQLTYASTGADSVSYDCVGTDGAYVGRGTLPATSGVVSGVALRAWAGHPSTCTYVATGPGGSTSFVETLTTVDPAVPKPTVVVTRSPDAMVAGDPYVLTWATTNATALNYDCVATAPGYVGRGSLQPNGSISDIALAAWVGYPSTCTWTATGPGGTNTFVETLTTRHPLPTVSVTRTPAVMVAGQPYTVSWRNTAATSLTYNCTSDGLGYAGSGTLAVNSSTSGTALAAWVGHPSTCTWTATGPGGSSSYVETLRTDPPLPAPTVSVSRSPATMVAGEPYTVRWFTLNATALSYSCTAPGTGFSGSGSLAVNSSTSGTALAAWVGYPSTCTWTATGPGGSSSYVERLDTVHPAPTLSVQRNPTQMRVGRPYTLYWSSSNASTVTYDCRSTGGGYVGNGTLPATSGSVSGVGEAGWVGHPSTCTYTARGPGGTTTVDETLETLP